MRPDPKKLLDREKRAFNYTVSRARKLVEMGFGCSPPNGVFKTTIIMKPEGVSFTRQPAYCITTYVEPRDRCTKHQRHNLTCHQLLSFPGARNSHRIPSAQDLEPCKCATNSTPFLMDRANFLGKTLTCLVTITTNLSNDSPVVCKAFPTASQDFSVTILLW